MTDLALVVADADHARLHAALSLAAAIAATDKPARLFFHAASVAALAEGRHWPEDSTVAAGGLPTIAELIGVALDLGVRLIACQSGLAMTGLTPDMLADVRIETGGLVGFVAEDGAFTIA